jgi:iron complex transport system ATP-binding protein
MIEIKNLNFIYNDSHILKNINLSLNDGEIIGITGRGGCGKSIFLKILAAVIKEYQGDVLHNGRKLISYMKSDLQKIISYMDGETPDNPDDSVYNFSLLSRITYKSMLKPFSDYDIQVTEECLRSLGLEGIRDRKLGTLSDSLMKSVRLAHSFIREGEVLVLDNPTEGLSIHKIALMRKLLLKYTINGDRIVVMASHDLNFLLQTADRIIIMDEGTVFEDGPPEIVDADCVKKYFGADVLISRNIYNGKPEVHIFPED